MHHHSTEEEIDWGKGQTEESRVRCPVCRHRLLHLLPAMHGGSAGAADREAEKLSGAGGCGGPGVRRPHGFVLRRLLVGPTGLLLLQLRL